MRFWTSDLHFQHTNVIKYANRPFKTIERMDQVLIHNINQRATVQDTLVSLGDFMFYGKDRGVVNTKNKPSFYINQINPQVFNIKGNHDRNNKVDSIADIIITQVGPFQVSASHRPSMENPTNKLPIHLCGHVHQLWKSYYDKENHILNINVGVDVWNYNPVTDQELINYIRWTKKGLNI